MIGFFAGMVDVLKKKLYGEPQHQLDKTRLLRGIDKENIVLFFPALVYQRRTFYTVPSIILKRQGTPYDVVATSLKQYRRVPFLTGRNADATRRHFLFPFS